MFVCGIVALVSVMCVSEANPEKFNSRFWNKMYYASVSSHFQSLVSINQSFVAIVVFCSTSISADFMMFVNE